ncbi:unnamed protein product [Rotaria sordida]|uniref:Uncharacterized protein n=1 Tax=Rotaria sordida TaxID=392033 RepID=A0A819HNB3_9BILA|nr:unnamed protein product [Rotaria sordida]
MDKNGLSRLSILNSNGKEYLYRLRSSHTENDVLLLIAYPSKDIVAYLQGQWRNETLNVTYDIFNYTTNQWTNGTIKKTFNVFIEKYFIEWDGQNFLMKKKLFSINHKFYDENQDVLAQFRMRFRWFNWSLIKYDLKIYSDKLLDAVYFFSIAIVDHNNIFQE